MSFFRKAKKVLSSKKYRENPNPENLSQERMAALNIGAINSEQTCYYCDSLTTGEKVYEIKGNLENFYDITDHDSSAKGGQKVVETVPEELKERCRQIFIPITESLEERGSLL